MSFTEEELRQLAVSDVTETRKRRRYTKDECREIYRRRRDYMLEYAKDQQRCQQIRRDRWRATLDGPLPPLPGRIIAAIKASPTGCMRARDLTEALHEVGSVISVTLTRMVKDGRLVRVRRGWYALPSSEARDR